jgi:pimeloyl-ACP methyl ester carboxylesterase
MATKHTGRRLRVAAFLSTACVVTALSGCAHSSAPDAASTASNTAEPVITDGPDGGHYVDVDGIHVYYKDRGTGPVLLLLHGGLNSQANWEPIAPELAKSFRVITPDTRGQGRTNADAAELTYRLFADDAAGLLAALHIPKALVVGHSDGGDTALEMGLHYADRVDGLVLMGTPYNVSNYYPGVLDELKNSPPDPQYWDPATSTQRTRADYDAFWHRLVNVMWAVEPNMTLDQLRAITAPTLVLHASHDEYFGAVSSQELAAALPRATFEMVPDSGHEFATDNPTFIVNAVRNFAKQTLG